jgi:integrase
LQEIIDRPGVRMAQIVFQHIASFYKWVIDQDIVEGFETSPTANIDTKSLFGKRKSRDRVLTDPEIAAFWRASSKIAYPRGELFRLLLLTGCRLSEIAGAKWSELNADRTTLSIPASRYKTGIEHVVPLTTDARAVLNELPSFSHGDYLFSSTFGKMPVIGYGNRTKARLDKLMAQELEREVEPWTVHDLRRTVATNLQKLGIELPVTEAVLGHISGSRAGVVGIYQRHQYADEKRAALEAWALKVREITHGVADNVEQLPAWRGDQSDTYPLNRASLFAGFPSQTYGPGILLHHRDHDKMSDSI